MLALWWAQAAWALPGFIVGQPEMGKVGKSSTVFTPTLAPALPSFVTVAWTSTTLPPGLQINSGTGAISGIPEQSGRYPVTVKALLQGPTESTDFASREIYLTIAGKPSVYPELQATPYAEFVSLRGGVNPNFLPTTASIKIYGAGGVEIAALTPIAPPNGLVAANVSNAHVEGDYFGLVCGTRYEFSFVATNELGTDVNPGGRFNTIPCAPTGLAAMAGDGQVSLAFNLLTGEDDPIVDYVAQCSSTDGGASASIRGSGSPIVVSQLTNGKTYSCTVAAHNMLGRDGVPATSQSFIPKSVQGAVAAVPTLSEWALMLLGLLAAGFGVSQARRRA